MFHMPFSIWRNHGWAYFYFLVFFICERQCNSWKSRKRSQKNSIDRINGLFVQSQQIRKSQALFYKIDNKTCVRMYDKQLQFVSLFCIVFKCFVQLTYLELDNKIFPHRKAFFVCLKAVFLVFKNCLRIWLNKEIGKCW